MAKEPQSQGHQRGTLVAQDFITRGAKPWPCTPRLSRTSREFIGGCFQGRRLLWDMSQEMLALDEVPLLLHIPADSRDRLGGHGRLCHPLPSKPLCAQFCILAKNNRT